MSSEQISKSSLGFESYVFWERAIVAHCRTCHSKVFIKFAFTKKSVTSDMSLVKRI